MRILFVQDSAINESLALVELSAVLRKAGNQTGLLLENEEPHLLRAAQRFAPDLVCVGISLSNHPWGYRVAQALRAGLPVPLVMAGIHPTFFPEHCITHGKALAAIIGEAETPLLGLVQQLEKKGDLNDLRDIPGIAYEAEAGTTAGTKHPGKVVKRTSPGLPFDVTQIPVPHRALYWDRYPFVRRFPWKKLTTSRGCLHACSHCVNPTMNDLYAEATPAVRKKGVEQVLEELHHLWAGGPLTQIHFADDLFTADIPWLERFAPLYRAQIGIPFTCNSSADLMSARAASALREAGCHGVAIALEAGNEQVRRDVLNRQFSNERYRDAVLQARTAGLQVMSFNMVGTPGETLEDIRATIRLNRSLNIPFQRVSLCSPLAQTRLAEKAIRLGWLNPEQVEDLEGDWSTTPWRTGLMWRGKNAPSEAEKTEMVKLYHLFRLFVHHPRLEATFGDWLMRLPTSVLAPLQATTLLHEQRYNNIPLLAGLRFFRHVGSPNGRTNITPTLL